MQIGLKDILGWCQHPDNPRECLEEVYKVLRVVLGKGDKESSPDSDEEIPSTVISAREQMYEAMSGSAVTTKTVSKVDISSSLKAGIEATTPDEKYQIPERTVNVTYMMSDKYDDGLFAIRDPDYLKLLRETHAQYAASSPPIYFPFGFGKDKDHLKIKKAKYGAGPKQMTLTLKFSRWERDGKIGYSCYAKTK